MEVRYICNYHTLVVKIDIPNLDREAQRRIKVAIERKLTTNPDLYGLPLRTPLHHLWKLRVGDYRVIYIITKNTVKIVAIGHRKNVYRMMEKREARF